jgi:serine/threonine protein kinase
MSAAKIKLINQGTYGCVFHPGVACDGKVESVNYVTKIQRNERTIKNELEISEKILKIKGYTKYFVPILKKCNVKIRKDDAENLRKCRVFKHHTDEVVERSSYVSMKIRYVGDTTLERYILNVPSSQMWNEVLSTHSHLLDGVKKLIEHGIVHNDIRANNVMYDTKYRRPVFIDFGLSFSIDALTNPDTNLHKIFYTFNIYEFWCIEVIICNYIFDVVGSANARTELVEVRDLERILETFLYGLERTFDEMGNPKIQNFLYATPILNNRERITNFNQVYMNFVAKFIGKTWFNAYKELIQYCDTWDNYAIAVVYLMLLEEFSSKRPDEYSAHLSPGIAKQYIDLLEDIIYSSPDKRPSLSDTKARMSKIMRG